MRKHYNNITMSFFSPTVAVVKGWKRPSQKERSRDVLPTLELPTRTTLNRRSGRYSAPSFVFKMVIKHGQRRKAKTSYVLKWHSLHELVQRCRHTCWVSLPTGCPLGDMGVFLDRVKHDFFPRVDLAATGMWLGGGMAERSTPLTTLDSVSLCGSSSSPSTSSSSSLSWCSRGWGPPWSRCGRWSSSIEMTRRRGHPSGGASNPSSSPPVFFTVSTFFARSLSFPVILLAATNLLDDLLALAFASCTLGGAALTWPLAKLEFFFAAGRCWQVGELTAAVGEENVVVVSSSLQEEEATNTIWRCSIGKASRYW